MRLAGHRQWKHLARERIEDITPTIPLGRKYWALEKTERTELDQFFAHEGQLPRLMEGIRGSKPDHIELATGPSL